MRKIGGERWDVVMERTFSGRKVLLVITAGVLLFLVFNLIGFSGEDEEEPQLSVYFVDTGETRTMDMEEYIMGVVAAEMDEGWPVNAYAAQAILARTFTLHFIEEGGSEHGADISTDHEEAQAYDAEKITDSIREAVEKTRGEVITYDDQYISAWFHAASGGRTATPDEGLNFDEDQELPYIEPVDSPDMGDEVPDDVRSWEAEFSEEEIINALHEMGNTDITAVDEIEIEEEGPSGRAVNLNFIHDEEEELVHAADFRIALDAIELRSTFFTEPIEKEDGMFIFNGKGYGHGVGMSQWGAFVLAEDDTSPEDIVNHYFKNVNVMTKWE